MRYLLLFALLFAPAAHATTLEEALAHALGKNPAYLSAQDNYQANYSAQFVTFAEMLPSITGFAQGTRIRSRLDNPEIPADRSRNHEELDNDSFGVEIKQTIFAGGRHVNAYRGRKAEVRANKHQLNETEQQTLLRAITAYFDVVQNDAVVNLNKSNLEVLQKQFQAQKDRFDAGVATRTAVAQAEAGVANARAGLLVAQAQAATSRAVYREVIGINPVDLTKPTRLPAVPLTLAVALEEARSESHTLRASQEGATAAKFSYYSAIGSALPDVQLTGRYTYTESDATVRDGIQNEETSVTLRLNVPLVRGGRTYAGVAAAQYAANAVRNDVHTAANAVERAVVAAWSNYQATDAAIPARLQQIRASEIALEGVREENNLGTRTVLDVLDTEQNYLNARVALVRAERDRFVAVHNLLASMGRLTARDLGIRPKK